MVCGCDYSSTSCFSLFYCLFAAVKTIKTEGKSGPETREPVTDTASAATVTATVQPTARLEAKLVSQSSTSSLEEEEEDIEVMLKSGQAKYLSTERTETSVKPPTTTGKN